MIWVFLIVFVSFSFGFEAGMRFEKRWSARSAEKVGEGGK